MISPTHFAIFRFGEDGRLGREEVAGGNIASKGVAVENLALGKYRLEFRDAERTISRETIVVEAKVARKPPLKKQPEEGYVPTEKPVPVTLPPPEPKLPEPDPGSKYPFLDGAYPGISLPLLESLYQECESEISKLETEVRCMRSAVELYSRVKTAHLFENHALWKKPALAIRRAGSLDDLEQAAMLLQEAVAAATSHRQSVVQPSVNWPKMSPPQPLPKQPAPQPVKLVDVTQPPYNDTVTPAERADDEPFKAPLLKMLSQQRPLLLVGGLASPETTAWIRARLGGQVLWESVHKHAGSSTTTPIYQRIIHRKYSAVIMLQELISHRVSNPLQDACKAAAVPFSLGGKAGRHRIRQAVAQIESVLETQQEKRARP